MSESGSRAKAHQRCDVDPVEEGPGLLGGEDRGLAGLDDVLWSTDGTRGVEGQDLADDEPVEEHPQRHEVLLDGRGRAEVSTGMRSGNMGAQWTPMWLGGS